MQIKKIEAPPSVEKIHFFFFEGFPNYEVMIKDATSFKILGSTNITVYRPHVKFFSKIII